ncbi:hypothetical protein GCK72_020143 [Caenorhabditis remanei]|uniref:Serpentine Receptor, class H n=1 Tax=Caenorhabditis remanei TaxID=31234 RepID=A0A6A5GFV3_CAERE|nr:hypothetical protein GCK72_020143 [Caenorhabditis remanei]KAF1753586.1 hypothetical protein GCK72_020143 [Caenorhabditis remanei]
MSSVKCYMFNVHFWSALLDLSFSFLTSPYILFPYVAGYGSGFLMWLGVSPLVQVSIVIIEIGLTVMSILVLFENRFTILGSSSKVWNRFRKIFIVVLYVFALFYIIPFSLLVPDQEMAVPMILEKLPSLRCFYTGPVIVFTLDATLIGWTTAIKLTIEFLFILIMCIMTYLNIKNQNKQITLSRKTLSLQKKFFISLITQTAIPVAVIILPLACCAYSVVSDYYSQAVNNVCFLIISNHGLVTTFAILFIHKPYREATFPCLETKWRYKTDVVISIVLPTID